MALSGVADFITRLYGTVEHIHCLCTSNLSSVQLCDIRPPCRPVYWSQPVRYPSQPGGGYLRYEWCCDHPCAVGPDCHTSRLALKWSLIGVREACYGRSCGDWGARLAHRNGPLSAVKRRLCGATGGNSLERPQSVDGQGALVPCRLASVRLVGTGDAERLSLALQITH